MSFERVWKYPLQVVDRQIVALPVGARVLSVQVQQGLPCVWAAVLPSDEAEMWTISMVGTGNPLPEDRGDYLGTCQMSGGTFVLHVFCAREVPS